MNMNNIKCLENGYLWLLSKFTRKMTRVTHNDDFTSSQLFQFISSFTQFSETDIAFARAYFNSGNETRLGDGVFYYVQSINF